MFFLKPVVGLQSETEKWHWQLMDSMTDEANILEEEYMGLSHGNRQN